MELETRQCLLMPLTPAASVSQQPADDSQALAEIFAPWFYNILNGQNPSDCLGDPSQFSEEYFCPNATLDIYWLPMGDKKTFETAAGVSAAFSSLVNESQIRLAPDLKPGSSVRGYRAPEGMVYVSVEGAVQQLNSFLGFFEQAFSLKMCDLMSPGISWRIKHSQLRLMYKMDAVPLNSPTEQYLQQPSVVT